MAAQFVEYAEESCSAQTFVGSVFVQDVKRKKNVMKDIQVVKITTSIFYENTEFLSPITKMICHTAYP